MAAHEIAAAFERVASVLRRRPEAGIGDDTPARAEWAGGTRVITHDGHGQGLVVTDLPTELGGQGEAPSAVWLLRAALASCVATRVLMEAALQDIELRTLDVQAGSRSDARGLLGLPDDQGRPVPAGPAQLSLQVRLGADGVAAERLQALVASAARASPVAATLHAQLPLLLQVVVEPPGPAVTKT